MCPSELQGESREGWALPSPVPLPAVSVPEGPSGAYTHLILIHTPAPAQGGTPHVLQSQHSECSLSCVPLLS